ncbi:MAG: trypsin-like peptidase domain-containing protein [Bdellovibrionaceae bacterium]|nr:trypsin-like peptidase domain-containing protein [Bdellovibrio sp.]
MHFDLVKNLGKKLLCSFSICTIVVLHSPFASADEIDKIIGKNDFVIVNAKATNIPFRYQKLVDSIGLLKSGCTVTHIGLGYAITAGHCFWAPPAGKFNMPCEDETIQWGLREGAEPYLTSQCKEIIAAVRNNDEYDFAIIKVDPIPPTFIPVDLNHKPLCGQALTLFSHPDFEPLRWSKSCVVEKNLHPDFSPLALQHKCDSLKGSSGAALLDRASLKIVAVHVGGAEAEPDRNEPAFPAVKSGLNYGTYVLGTPFEAALRQLGFK